MSSSGYRAEHLAVRDLRPKSCRPVLVKPRDIPKVGLVVQRNRDSEFVSLNANNEGSHALPCRATNGTIWIIFRPRG